MTDGGRFVFREVAFAVVLLICAAGFTVGVAFVAGDGVAWMVGSVLVAAWSWLALSSDRVAAEDDET